MNAVVEVYRAKGMSDEEIKEIMPQVIKDNVTKFERSFPKRMRINPDGSQEVFINEINKFDFEDSEGIKMV